MNPRLFGSFPCISGHVATYMALLLAIHALLFIVPTAAYTELSDDFLSGIPSGDADFDIKDGKLLAPILIPRVPGTEGQARAQEHFVAFFREELPEWRVEWYNSTSTTPATGDRQVPFANLLFRRDPPWTRDSPGRAGYLTLVAHYDSKLKPDGFIGATDSAAPCAMLMHVARSIEGHLVRMWEDVQRRDGEGGKDLGVQILLLDGEEAFVSWTATDSLYGARALAEEWENTANPALSTFRSPLGQINLFLLLDLLGSAGPSVPSFFQSTHWAYRAMARIEERMRGLGTLESDPKKPFLPDADKKASDFRPAGVGDDHIPFMRRGVPVLHIIPSPFPTVWHTMDDDGEHLDLPTVRDWARIVTAFALEWLDVKADGASDATPPHPQGRGVRDTAG
ncbi:hypothetical protein DL767_004434 [Monosporascus sp. MG133]|nr:hypothetical protein DL767_004434 [Monosporascus sp. MG133]